MRCEWMTPCGYLVPPPCAAPSATSLRMTVATPSLGIRCMSLNVSLFRSERGMEIQVSNAQGEKPWCSTAQGAWRHNGALHREGRGIVEHSMLAADVEKVRARVAVFIESIESGN